MLPISLDITSTGMELGGLQLLTINDCGSFVRNRMIAPDFLSSVMTSASSLGTFLIQATYPEWQILSRIPICSYYLGFRQSQAFAIMTATHLD